MTDRPKLRSVDQSLIVELIEEATLSEPGSVRPNASLLDNASWDSMGMVMFISLVKERFDVELSAHDLRECLTAEDLRLRIEERSAELAD